MMLEFMAEAHRLQKQAQERLAHNAENIRQSIRLIEGAREQYFSSLQILNADGQDKTSWGSQI